MISIKQHTAAHFSKAASSYDQYAHVQKQAADIILKSLDSYYAVTLDLGSGPFVNSFELKKRSGYVVSADLSEAMLAEKVTTSVCADMDELPFLPNSFDLVFSNFAMQWSADIAMLFKQIHQVLKPGGKAHFSLVIEGTLSEIAQSFAAVDGKSHINSFLNEATLDSALKQSNLIVQSLSFCHHKIYYPSAKLAFNSIKAIGANFKNGGQTNTGLMGKTKYQQLLANYPMEQNQYPVSYHVAYIVVEK